MGIFIFIGIVIIMLVLLYFWLRKPKPKPTTTTTTTLSPLPTTTIAPIVECYNLKISANVLNNGIDNLWIETRTLESFVSKPYNQYDDCGLYLPDYCINICSIGAPTYKYGENGVHVTIEGIIETVTGICENGYCV